MRRTQAQGGKKGEWERLKGGVSTKVERKRVKRRSFRAPRASKARTARNEQLEILGKLRTMGRERSSSRLIYD